MEDSFFSFFEQEKKTETTEKQIKQPETKEIKKKDKRKKENGFLTHEELNKQFGESFDLESCYTDRLGITVNDEYQTFLSYDKKISLKNLKIKLTELSKMSISIGNKIIIRDVGGKVEITLYPSDSLDYIYHGIMEDPLEFIQSLESQDEDEFDLTSVREMMSENGEFMESDTDFFLMVYHLSISYIYEIKSQIRSSDRIGKLNSFDFSNPEEFSEYYNDILNARMKNISNFFLLFSPLTKELFSDTNKYEKFRHVYDFYLTIMFNICNDDWMKILFAVYEKFIRDCKITNVTFRTAHTFEKIPTDLDDINDLIFCFSSALYDGVAYMSKYKNLISKNSDNCLNEIIGFEKWSIESEEEQYSLDGPGYSYDQTNLTEEEIKKKNLCLSFLKTFDHMLMKIFSFVTYNCISGESFYKNEFIVGRDEQEDAIYNEKLLFRSKEMAPLIEKPVYEEFSKIIKLEMDENEIQINLLKIPDLVLDFIMKNCKNKEKLNTLTNIRTIAWASLLKIILSCSHVV